MGEGLHLKNFGAYCPVLNVDKEILMKDLAMHIMDIAENSVRAGAKEVLVSLEYVGDNLYFTIRDNGCGMDKEMVDRVTDPFVTSRTTRKVGLGLPFLKMNALQTGGSLGVDSKPGVGTVVKAHFCTDHIDCIPNGDLSGTLALLITGNPRIHFRIEVKNGDQSFDLSTRELEEVLEGLPLSHPKVNVQVREMFKENLEALGVRG
jgi:signal transduction histidine kinase